MTADVLIVGAGPAGASLAIRLGRAGFTVLLLDRARFPRDAVCGEALSPGARGLLAELGLDDALAAEAWPYRGVRLVGPDGRSAEAFYPGTVQGLSLPRLKLDARLAACAAATPGVTLIEGATVVALDYAPDGAVTGVGLDDGRRFAARAVVAADGRRSRVRTLYFNESAPAPASRFCFLAPFEGGTLTDDMLQCGLAGPGLQYVRVCQGPGRFAVCLVVDDATRKAHEAGTPAGFRELIATRLPGLARELVGCEPGAMRGMPLSPYAPPALAADGLVVVGDAAGFMDPITGEGMYRAFAGAAMAAEALAHALRVQAEGPVRRGDMVTYEVAMQARFGPLVRFVDWAVTLTTLPTPATSLFVGVMRHWPAAATAIAAAQGALIPPDRLFAPHRWPRASAI